MPRHVQPRGSGVVVHERRTAAKRRIATQWFVHSEKGLVKFIAPSRSGTHHGSASGGSLVVSRARSLFAQCVID